MRSSLLRSSNGYSEGIDRKSRRKAGSRAFLRLNRSCLVRIDFIRELHSWSHGEYRVILLSGKMLTWTRRYLNRHPELLRKL
ncbi:LytTR family transcriptional regulator DNA-binding domain-containing protein [Edaphobacter modestus]|uniref:LytTR family transcriptional regulator DNA-binding domain-containing protein n=1 Tax=Edaphobacter modestus TaxID=388466 RepID=UPI00102B2E74